MAKEIGNPELLEVWASEGETSTPFVSKQRQGWLFQEQPPSALMNWVHNEQQQKINHLLKHGVSEWSPNTEYERGAIVKHDNTAWRALRDNDASEPADDNEDWAEVSTLPIIRAPDLISPIDGEIDVVPAAELVASEYAPVYSVDDRDYREFQVDTAGGDFSDPIRTNETDADSWTVDPPLDTDKGYLWRCRDVSVRGDISSWSDVEGFTTGNIFIDQPSITEPPDNATDIPETPTLESSAFSVTGGSDTHVASYWRIFQGSTEVWASGRTTDDLTSIDVPSGVLDDGETVYTVQVRHEGDELGLSSWSDPSTFTTQDSFVRVATPSITSPLEGETDIGETPTFESSEFEVINGADTHVASFWEVYDDSDILVWASGRTMTNRTSITIPAGNLQDGETTYKVRVRHEGDELGVSEWSDTVSFVTADTFGELFSGAEDNTMRKIIPSDMTQSEIFEGSLEAFLALAFGSDGFLYSGSTNSTVRKIDPSDMTEAGIFEGHTGLVLSLAFGSDGFLYSSSDDNTVRKIDPSDMTQAGIFEGHTANVTSLAFGSDGFLYSGSNDNTVRKVDPSDMTEEGIFEGHTASVLSLAFGSDGFLYSGSQDDTVRKIDPSDMTQSGIFEEHTGAVVSLAFGSDGFLYSGSRDDTVRKVDPSDMTEAGIFEGHTNNVKSLAFGSDGFLYSGASDSTVRKIDPSDMTQAGIFEGHTSAVLSVAYNISIPELLGFTS